MVMKGEPTLNSWEEEVKIYFVGVAGLTWLGPRPLLLTRFTMENARIYGGDCGGDDGMVITLVREITGEIDAKVGLCHWKGSGNVVID